MRIHWLFVSITVGALGVFNASAQSTDAFSLSQRKAIEQFINRAVADALRTSTSRSESMVPTEVPEDAIAGFSEQQRAALGAMIDAAVERARSNLAADGIDAHDESRSPPGIDDDNGSEEEIAGLLGECGVDGEGNPINDFRIERWLNEGFDVEDACRSTGSSEGLASGALAITNPGPNDAATGPRGSSVQILTNNANSRVSLKLDFSSPAVDASGDGVVYARSLVLSAPVNKKDSQGTNLFGLGGISNNFQMNLNLSRIRTDVLGSRNGTGNDLPLLFMMPDACRDLDIKLSDCNYSTLLRVASSRARKGDADTTPGYGPDGRPMMKPSEILRLFSVPGHASVRGFRLKAGYDDFSFFDPQDLSKRSQGKVPWSAGVYLGRLSTSSYYAAGLDFQHEYRAASTGTACPSELEGPVVRCVTGALGAPTSAEEHLVWVEGRWLVRGRGVSATVVHDLKGDEWEVSVPIYLFPDAKDLLTGGIRFGWTSKDKFSGGIFVGVPFKFLD